MFAHSLFVRRKTASSIQTGVISPLHLEPLIMSMADEINPRILGEWLAGMSLPERARTLNKIAYNLTICAREFEAATQPFKDPAAVIKMLIGLSESQHQLSQQIGHYMDGEEIKVYPIDVFAKILFEKATQYQILPFLTGVMIRMRTRM